MRTTLRSPCQPTASSGLNGKVTVESWLRRFTDTFQVRSSCWARKASSMRGVSSIAGSKIACRPTRPFSGRVKLSLVASTISDVVGLLGASRHIVPRGITR